MGQALIVAVLVTGAFGYTGWVLMPAAWRQALRRRLGVSGASGKSGATIDAGGCGGCSGCAGAGAAPNRHNATAVIKLQRRADDEAPTSIKS